MADRRTALAVIVAASGISKNELARELGCGRTSLWEILNGHREPSPEFRSRLFEVLGRRVFEGVDKAA